MFVVRSTRPSLRQTSRSLKSFPKSTAPFVRNFQSGQSILSPDRDQAAVLAIIGLNIAVTLNWHFGYPLTFNQLHHHFIASTYFIFSNEPFKYAYTLITSSFSQASPMHLAMNMFTFYFFSNDIFQRFGRRFGVGLYLVAGGVSSFAALYHARYVEKSHLRVLGASGAVCAFVSLSVLLNPTSIVLLYAVIPVPAAVFGVGYVLKELWASSGVNDGESHVSHLAGAAVGALAFVATKGKKRFY